MEFEASIQRVIAWTVKLHDSWQLHHSPFISNSLSFYRLSSYISILIITYSRTQLCRLTQRRTRDCTFYQVLHFSVLIQKRTTVRSSYKNYCELLFERHANCSLETFRDFRRGENRLKFPHTRRFSLSISVPLHSTKARSDSQGTSRETSAKFHGEIKAQFHPLIIVKRYRQPFVSRR